MTEGEKTLIEEYYNQLNDYAPDMLTNIDDVTKAWKGTSDELNDIIEKQNQMYIQQARAQYVAKIDLEIADLQYSQQETLEAMEELEAHIYSRMEQSSNVEMRRLAQKIHDAGGIGFEELYTIMYDSQRYGNDAYGIQKLIKEYYELNTERFETGQSILELEEKQEYFEQLLQESYGAISSTSATSTAKKAGEAVGTAIGESLSDALKRIAAVANKKFGVNLKIPALATGSVIPPNREFLALVGDNKQEPEVVSPLSTIRQAVSEALALSGRTGGGNTPFNVILELNGKEMARALVQDINSENSRIGVSLIKN